MVLQFQLIMSQLEKKKVTGLQFPLSSLVFKKGEFLTNLEGASEAKVDQQIFASKTCPKLTWCVPNWFDMFHIDLTCLQWICPVLTWLDLSWFALSWLDLTWIDLFWLDLSQLYLSEVDLSWTDQCPNLTCLNLICPDLTCYDLNCTDLTSFNLTYRVFKKNGTVFI